MASLDAVKNFAKVTVSTGYDASATSIVLTTGHGAKLPAPATDGAFNVVWWNSTDYSDPSDDPNVEIVRVTARSTDTLTVTRAQESTSATTKNTGSKTYKMILGATAKMITDIQTATQTGSMTFAADAQASDTYVITLAPVPSAYTTGMVVSFSANTANTGAATLNVNSLGAKTIKKLGSEDLDTGDIKAGQMVEVQYDGTNFQLISKASKTLKKGHGVFTRLANDTDNTQTIAHGLGRTPTWVRIWAMWAYNALGGSKYGIGHSFGTYDGSTMQTAYLGLNDENVNDGDSLTTTSYIIYLPDSSAENGKVVASISVDATNISLTWTKSGTVTGDTISVHWEAEVDA